MSLHANILHFHFDRNETNIIKKIICKIFIVTADVLHVLFKQLQTFFKLFNFPDKLSDNIISLMLVSILLKGGRRKKRLLYFCVSFYA